MSMGDPTRSPERAAELRQSYLTHPGEAPEVDYKAAKLFKADDDFALDLVRHILGMANAGGGAIVVGFKEDHAKKPQPDPLMDDTIVASYDASQLASYVEKHVRGTDKAKVRIFKEPHGGRNYPIIEIEGFERTPYFCRSTKQDSTGKEVLRDGALYFRTDSARTVQIAGPSEWEKLIAICVQRRQDEFLGRFSALMEQMGFGKPSGPGGFPKARGDEALARLAREGVAVVEQELTRHDFPRAYFEGVHSPAGDSRWPADLLLAAAERSKLHRSGWPIGVVLHGERGPRPTTRGIEASIYSDVIRRSYDYWRLDRDGGFYFARTYQEDSLDNAAPGTILWFDIRIWRIAETFEHAAALYRELGVSPSDPIRVHIRHAGLRGRLLTSSDPMRNTFLERRSTEDEITWSGEVTQDQIKAQLKDLVRSVCEELYLLFDFFRPVDAVYDEILANYLASRV